MSDTKCTCANKDLLDFGCTCGFFKREKRDKEIVAKREADEARARLVELAAWWSPMPDSNAGVMLPDECGTCGHSASNHIAKNWTTNQATACNLPNCLCVAWRRKI